MSGTLHGEIEVRGTAYEVQFSSVNEYFSTVVDGTRIASSSWAGLASAINTELRKREVAVSVDFVDPDRARKGNTTRLHASQRKPMITWEAGGKSVEDITYPLRPDTDLAELRRLIDAVKAANKALQDFRDNHKLGSYSLSNVVAEEIARVIAERDAAERAEGAIDLDDNGQEPTT